MTVKDLESSQSKPEASLFGQNAEKEDSESNPQRERKIDEEAEMLDELSYNKVIHHKSM